MKLKSVFYFILLTLMYGTVSPLFAKAPTTSKIAFTSRRDGNFEIYSMNTDGSDQINLTQHRARDSAPVWSPTGEHILFVSDRDGVEDLYLMNPDGTNVRQVFKKLIGREFPTWSPDGKALAYQRFHTFSIYTASIDGKNETKVADGLWPTWSPNGSEIAFMAAKFVWGGNGNLQAPNVRVQIINLQTHVEEALLPVGTSMFDPAWAPDSTQIAFSWRRIIFQGREVIENKGIYVANRNGSGLRKIIEAGDPIASVFNPTWSPDGKTLIYNEGVGGVRNLFKVDLDSDAPERLTQRQGDNFNADWFDPAYALPVSPQPTLLTTTWGKQKKE